ncbi:MAG: YihY family inner membrane protein, partial [Kiloniellales bacterium]|nr:YihY family inner membrane protein [Kiloniellales bacterium]
MALKWEQLFKLDVIGFPVYIVRRFAIDNAPRIASSLSFATLLALVPLFSVIFATFSLVPSYQHLFQDLQAAVLDNLLPEIGDQVKHQLKVFVENANTISGVSFFVLLLTVYLVVSNVLDAFNAIWRVSEPRPFWIRFSLKWAIILLGPPLIGVSITLSSYAFAQVEWLGIKEDSDILVLSELLQLVTAVAGFSALYFFLPARRIKLSDALSGGLVAGLLFETLKSFFGIYLRLFPSHEVIYGALAAFPVVLVWTYLVWLVILLGAEITASLPEWRAGVRKAKDTQDLAQRFFAALHILKVLSEAKPGLAGVSENDLRFGLPIGPGAFGEVLYRLRAARIIQRRWGHWSLR